MCDSGFVIVPVVKLQDERNVSTQYDLPTVLNTAKNVGTVSTPAYNATTYNCFYRMDKGGLLGLRRFQTSNSACEGCGFDLRSPIPAKNPRAADRCRQAVQGAAAGLMNSYVTTVCT